MVLRQRVAIKRVYDEPSQPDGFRVLVDRLWPRGLTKESARVDLWLRDLAPSNELRKWFHANPEHWNEFRRKYLIELRTAADALKQLYDLLDQGKNVTLVFASKRADQNNASVLKEFLEGMKKPPRGTGDQRQRAQKQKRS